MDIGYARVSTKDQNLDSQIDRLKQAGCEKIYSEKAGGGRAQRKELEECLEYLRDGDVLVVTKLDRLGRTVRQLIQLLETFKERGIGFKSLRENIDTTTAMGTFFFHVIAAFGELEREMIIERTNTGLEAARARGRVGGRPKTISQEQLDLALELYNKKEKTVEQIVSLVGISKATLYRATKKQTRKKQVKKKAVFFDNEV